MTNRLKFYELQLGDPCPYPYPYPCPYPCRYGVVGKFVEFYGSGLEALSVADRATIANMGPEYGATCGFFPVDGRTLEYITQTGRIPQHVSTVEAYLKHVGMFRSAETEAGIEYPEQLTLDMGTIIPCVAGPKRPHDNVSCKDLQADFQKCMATAGGFKGFGIKEEDRTKTGKLTYEGKEYDLSHGGVVIAAITSCTNTSNPAVLIAAGLVAKRAKELGLVTRPYIKTPFPTPIPTPAPIPVPTPIPIPTRLGIRTELKGDGEFLF